MSKPLTMLKNLTIKSVSFVTEGANPRADVMITKSKETVIPPDEELSLFQRFKKWLHGEGKEDIEKDAQSFDDVISEEAQAAIDEEIWKITYALRESLSSILRDGDLNSGAKSGAMVMSLEQFADAVSESIPAWCSGKLQGYGRPEEAETADVIALMRGDADRLQDRIEKGMKPPTEPKGEIEAMIMIDKSKMTPEEAALYESLIQKYAFDDSAKGTTEPAPTVVDKSAQPAVPAAEPAAPVENGLVKALEERIKEQDKLFAKMQDELLTRDMLDVAKKYEPIGKKADELVPVLKSMKAVSEDVFKSYVESLDNQLALQERSGIFTEIGKSTSGASAAGGATDSETKVDAIAKQYREADPGLSYEASIAKAWEDNPDLIDAYEREAGF